MTPLGPPAEHLAHLLLYHLATDPVLAMVSACLADAGLPTNGLQLFRFQRSRFFATGFLLSPHPAVIAYLTGADVDTYGPQPHFRNVYYTAADQAASGHTCARLKIQRLVPLTLPRSFLVTDPSTHDPDALDRMWATVEPLTTPSRRLPRHKIADGRLVMDMRPEEMAIVLNIFGHYANADGLTVVVNPKKGAAAASDQTQ